MNRSLVALLCSVAPLAAVPPAFADCVGGGRRSTPEEQAYAKKLTAALNAALPAAPAPMALESEPQVIVQTACKDMAVGEVGAMISANYVASPNYNDRVKLTLRVNYPFPGTKDLVLGSLPKKPARFKVHNVVINVDGYKAQYMAAVEQALDRARLQALIDAPLPDEPPPVAWVVGKPGQASPKADAAATSAAPATSAGSTATSADQRGAAPAQPDPARAVADKTMDTVNKLRGLFGR